MNKSYEMTFLLDQEEELKTLKDLIINLRGKITKENNWGKKTLSYPIKKNRSANFYNWAFEMDAKKMKEFKTKLNFNDKLIRYLILNSEL